MNVIFIIIWILFVFSVALAALGIVLLFKVKGKGTVSDIHYVHYAQILFYTYGFYVLWGKLFILQIIPETKSNIDIVVLHNLNQIMGMPFLIVAFILFICWVYKHSKVKHALLHIVMGVVLIVFLTSAHYLFYNYRFLNNTSELSQIILALFSIWLSLIVYNYLEGVNSVFKFVLSSGLFFLAVVNVLNIFFYTEVLLVSAVVKFFYFLVVTVIPITFYYGIIFQKNTLQPNSLNTYSIKHLGVTQREDEVIKEIVNGLTNQQIADKLFITLQTVKDHNSRIYLKLGVKNRTQLIRLLREKEIQ